MGPGELWERIFTGPGMIFFKKIPVGKDPGNLQVHPCLTLDLLSGYFGFLVMDRYVKLVKELDLHICCLILLDQRTRFRKVEGDVEKMCPDS